MNFLLNIFTIANFSNIMVTLNQNNDFIILLFTIFSGLTFVVLLLEYFTKIPRYVIHRILTPTDSRVSIEYDKYFNEDEIEGFNRPYINRIEEEVERDVIKEVKEFHDSSYQVLIISGESGVGKTRLAIEVSKSMNSRLKFWRKCLFVNLRHYKDPEDIKEKLNKELLKNITLVFDDYQYNMDVFNEVKNIAFKRNSKLIITTRPIFHDGLKERIGQAGIKTIELHRMNVEGILSDISDEHLKEKIIKISEGIPSIALLALNYVKNAPVQEQSFFHSITSKTDFFNRIIHDFEDETSKEFVKFLAGGALIGGITQEDKFEDELLRFLQNGHIIKTGNKYRITPDVLSDYLIDYTFFFFFIKKSYFAELANHNNGEHILEIFNSVIRLNDNQDIYKEAAALLLKLMSEFEYLDINQRKTRIRMGISAYKGFGNIGLVVENLGEFWTDYGVLDDANDLLSLGIFLYNTSKFDDAKLCWHESEKKFHRNNDRIGISNTLVNMGNIHRLKGEYDDALEKYNDALEIKKELGDRSGIATTLNNMGNIHQFKGEYDDALEKYNDALEIQNELGNRSGIATTLNNMGNIHQFKDEYDNALEKYNNALEIQNELGDRSGIANTLVNMGNIHQLKGEYDEALEKYNDALEIQNKLGNRSGIATTLVNMGNIHQLKGEYDDALEKYNDALEIQKKLGDRSGIAMTKAQLGVFYRAKKNMRTSLVSFLNANRIFSEIEDEPNYLKTLINIATTVDSTDPSTILDIEDYLLLALQKVRDIFSEAEDKTTIAQIDSLISEIKNSETE